MAGAFAHTPRSVRPHRSVGLHINPNVCVHARLYGYKRASMRGTEQENFAHRRPMTQTRSVGGMSVLVPACRPGPRQLRKLHPPTHPRAHTHIQTRTHTSRCGRRPHRWGTGREESMRTAALGGRRTEALLGRSHCASFASVEAPTPLRTMVSAEPDLVDDDGRAAGPAIWPT